MIIHDAYSEIDHTGNFKAAYSPNPVLLNPEAPAPGRGVLV